MRQRVRIQPYVSRETQRELRIYSQTRQLTESAVTEVALAEYMGKGRVEPELVVRRLDDLAESVSRFQHDLDEVGYVLALLVRYTFFAAPVAPVRGAKERGDLLYAEFMARASKDLTAGARLAGEVFRKAPAAPPPAGGLAQERR